MEKIADSAAAKNYSQTVQLFSSCATVGMSTVGGAIIGGVPGALIGLTTSDVLGHEEKVTIDVSVKSNI